MAQNKPTLNYAGPHLEKARAGYLREFLWVVLGLFISVVIAFAALLLAAIFSSI